MSRIEREGQTPFTVFQSGFCSFPFCDVLYLNDVIERCALSSTKNRHAELDIDDRTVLADVTPVELISGNLPTSELTCKREVRIKIIGMGDRLERQRRQLGGGVADDFAERTIDTDETPIERDQCHPDGRFIDREPESLLGIAYGHRMSMCPPQTVDEHD